MSQAWFDTGFSGMDDERRRIDAQQGPQRFWITAGGSKDVVIVDDQPMCIHEHNAKIGGSYNNQLTCIQKINPQDAACCKILGPNSRYYCGYLTCVDCSMWQDKRGNMHQYEMRLLPLKFRSLKKFRRLSGQYDMKFSMWNFTREDKNAVQVGDDWNYKRSAQVDRMFPVVCYRGTKLIDLWAEAEANEEKMEQVTRVFQITPDEDHKLPRNVPSFNYFELLKPKSPDEIRLILGNVEFDENNTGSGSTYTASGAISEDDVPF